MPPSHFADHAARVHAEILGGFPWADILEAETRGNADPRNRAHAELSGPVPSPEELRALMNIAFHSTLAEEERRFARFSLAYGTADVVRASKLLPLPFANPAPFEPGAVAKIAPSVDLARTMLGVWPDETGHLRVWGLVHAGDRRFGIDLEIAPSFLRVVGLGPGVLSVSYGERHVIAYARGEAHFPERAELDVRRVLSTGIDTFHSRELGRLAERMLLHGHGGTILLLEPGVKPEALTHHPHYTFRPPNAVLRDAFKRDEDIRQNRVGPEAGESTEQFVRRRVLGQRERAGALNHVARLTAVDGAVVMTTALDVIGYGATIATGTTDAPRLRLLDPRKKTAEPVDVPFSILTGHRHKSAACFCAAQSGVGVAIVASQDGVLSLFGREADGAVLVVRPITV